MYIIYIILIIISDNSDNYSKTSGSLWQYSKDELTDSESFKSNIKMTGNTPADGNIKDIEIIVPLNI